MTAEQLIVLALLIASFGAGWLARGAEDSSTEADGIEPDAIEPDAPDADPPAKAPSSPEVPVGYTAGVAGLKPAPIGTAAAIDVAARQLALVVDLWLDDRDRFSTQGQRAVAKLDEDLAQLPTTAAAEPALAALHRARGCVERYRMGLILDAPTSRQLAIFERQIERAMLGSASRDRGSTPTRGTDSPS